jgi:tetrahydromethanopterin S-methyltransferase subunit H
VSVNSYTDLAAHAGHRVAVVIYAQENAAVECETCSVVLVDFARADETELAELLALAEQCGIAEDTLDETVHDMAAATGSRAPTMTQIPPPPEGIEARRRRASAAS